MRYSALVIGFMLTLSGCTQFALRNNTAQITNTLTDLQFQQVLDNVARFQDNPDTVPSFAVVTAGTVAVNDQAGTGLSATYSPTLSSSQQGGGALPILSLLFPFSVQRALSENWSLTPITDSDNLRRLRCAYRLLVMGEATPNYEFCHKQMREFFEAEQAALADYFPPRGWYGVGDDKGVPADAYYVGHHGRTTVWVTREGMNELALFTMGVLDLATGKLRTPQLTVIRKYKGEPKPENLVETEVTAIEDDQAAIKAIQEGRTRPYMRPRVTWPGAPFNPGMLMLPRP
jgi:hypothetical protein